MDDASGAGAHLEDVASVLVVRGDLVTALREDEVRTHSRADPEDQRCFRCAEHRVGQWVWDRSTKRSRSSIQTHQASIRSLSLPYAPYKSSSPFWRTKKGISWRANLPPRVVPSSCAAVCASRWPTAPPDKRWGLIRPNGSTILFLMARHGQGKGGGHRRVAKAVPERDRRRVCLIRPLRWRKRQSPSSWS